MPLPALLSRRARRSIIVTHEFFKNASRRRHAHRIPWVCDLASRGACDDLLAAAQSTVGQVTHLVHSAAPQRHETDRALAVTTETWERMHAVNVDASFHLARELARSARSLP